MKKDLSEQSLIRSIRLNLIRHQFYFTNYQGSFKSNLYQVLLKIDLSAKKEINKYLRRSSVFSEITGCRLLVHFNFPTISTLIISLFRNSSQWLLLSFQSVVPFIFSNSSQCPRWLFIANKVKYCRHIKLERRKHIHFIQRKSKHL